MPTNILFIHADQHRFDCVGANGHPLVRTPHLDSLARDGVNFSHAFSVSPVCVPARCSLMTGVWPSEHRAIVNFGGEGSQPMRADLPTFTSVLRDAGYRLGLVGEWHVDPVRSPLDYGYHEFVGLGEYGPWRAAQGLPPRPSTNGWLGETDPHITPEQSRLGWGADVTIAMLERCAAGDQPFFLRWDPVEPHLPNLVPEPYASLYPPASVPPWPSFPDSFVGKPYIQAQQLRTWGLDRFTWDDWAPVVARYLGEVSLLDAQLGRVLAALERLGLADNTLVVYSCDHGDMTGGHGMVDKHFVMYEDIVHVPLLARWPGVIPAGSGCDALVASAVDLAATFCEVAGAQVPATFRGTSLLGPVRREDVFSSYGGSQFGLYSQRMVRDRRWKYVWNCTAEDELYDLATDPAELVNRATDPACADELARLRARCVAWMEQTGDRLLNGWTRNQLLSGLKL